jgi:NB-ARC domain
VGRVNELAELHSILQSSDGGRISAIAGMGGLGKTQLAVQYATRHKADYPGGVCWLNGRTEDLAAQILFKAEFDRHLPGLQAVKERTTELQTLVKWCWQHWVPQGTTLLVLDDVTDWGQCRLYLPQGEQFRVLVTTRSQDLIRRDQTLSLEVLQLEEARSLLAKWEQHGRVAQDQTTADKLCAGLGYLPLGIELVGCYLARDAGGCAGAIAAV